VKKNKTRVKISLKFYQWSPVQRRQRNGTTKNVVYQKVLQWSLLANYIFFAFFLHFSNIPLRPSLCTIGFLCRCCVSYIVAIDPKQTRWASDYFSRIFFLSSFTNKVRFLFLLISNKGRRALIVYQFVTVYDHAVSAILSMSISTGFCIFDADK